MNTITRRRWGAAALVLAAIGAGGATPLAGDGPRKTYQNCGGTTVPPGHLVLAHAGIDDRVDGPPAIVLIQIYDRAGTVRAQKEAVLQPGQSTTLTMTVADPGGAVLRAHFEFREADVPVSVRRTPVSSVEVLDLTGVVRTACMPIDNGARPRPL